MIFFLNFSLAKTIPEVEAVAVYGGWGGGGEGGGQIAVKLQAFVYNILPPTNSAGKRSLDAFKPHFPAPVIR